MGSLLLIALRDNKMEIICLENLPTEVLVKILGYVHFKDLSSVSEVSKSFYSLATDPFLWKTFEVSHSLEAEELISTLSLDRFSKLETVHLSQGRICSCPMSNKQTIRIFESLENRELKHLTIQHFDITGLDYNLLLGVVKNTENVYFNHAVKMTKEQVDAFVEDIPRDGKMKCLQVENFDFSHVGRKPLSKAINSLNSFNSYYCEFSAEQMEVVFEEMAIQTNLTDFSYFNQDGLEGISPMVIAKAFNNLQRLYVGQCRLSPEQIFCIFQQMSCKTNLNKINFNFRDSYPCLLATIPSDILSKGLNKLEEVGMRLLTLSTTQMREVLAGVASTASKVKKLDLGENIVPDLSLAELKKLVIKLEPNEFKLHLQSKILEIYERTILSLRQELVEKEVRQVALRAEQVKLRAESNAVKSRIVNALTNNRKLKSFLASSNLPRCGKLLNKLKLTSKVQVQICKKSKFSSSFRFSTKSRVVKKSNILVKVKLLSKSHVCKL